jgi:hypothetical protein
MFSDEQEESVFEQIEREIEAHTGRRIAVTGLGAEAAIAVTDLCTAYRKIRHLLESAIPEIDPPAAATPIRLLMRIADSACKATMINQ